MKKILSLILILITIKTASAQIVIGTPAGACDSAAILDVRSHSKGFLVPRMDQNQADAVVNPAEGLMFYNTTTRNFNFYGGNTVIQIDSNGINSENSVFYRKTVQVENKDDMAYAVCATSDGGVLIAGSATIDDNGTGILDLYFLKLTSTGEQDKNFGTDGKVVINTGTYERIYSVIQTNDGGYAAAGYVTHAPGSGCVVKLKNDGSLDSQFGTNGTFYISNGSNQVFFDDIKQTADSGFIVVGSSDESTNNGTDIYIVKLTKTGSLDNGFNNDGTMTVGVQDEYEHGLAVDVTNNNKYFITGYTSDNSNGAMIVLKLNQDGTFNAGFNGGKIKFGDWGYEKGKSIFSTPDGGCIVTGSRLGIMFVAKIDSHVLSLKVRSFSGNDYYLDGLSSVKLNDSSFMVAGSASSKNNDSVYSFLVKLDTALNVVTTFGHNGYLILGDRFTNEFKAVCKTADNGIVAAGYTQDENQDEDIYIVKTNNSGRSCGNTYGLNVNISLFGNTNIYSPQVNSGGTLHNETLVITSQGTVTTICN
jgi:uncharacterized delta-60 repeat protein